MFDFAKSFTTILAGSIRFNYFDVAAPLSYAPSHSLAQHVCHLVTKHFCQLIVINHHDVLQCVLYPSNLPPYPCIRSYNGISNGTISVFIFIFHHNWLRDHSVYLGVVVLRWSGVGTLGHPCWITCMNLGHIMCSNRKCFVFIIVACVLDLRTIDILEITMTFY